MTQDKLLTLEGDELSRMLGEVLQVHGHHDFPKVGDYMDAECKLCGCWDNEWPAEQPCEKAVNFDPIPLTWPEAMKCFNAGVEKHGKKKMTEAMKQVYVATTHDTNGADYVLDWWPFHAGVVGNLRASAICEINNA